MSKALIALIGGVLAIILGSYLLGWETRRYWRVGPRLGDKIGVTIGVWIVAAGIIAAFVGGASVICALLGIR